MNADWADVRGSVPDRSAHIRARSAFIRVPSSAMPHYPVLAATYLIGISVLFNVGFLLLLPIMYRLQRDTGKSLLWFVLPLAFSLGVTHSLVPPHPGIVGAVNALTPEGNVRNTVMVQTILFGTLMGIPVVLAGWLGPGRLWAR